MKCYKTIITVSTLIISLNLNASIIDNGSYTTDTSTGIDWLDLTATSNRSYDDISSELGSGGEFEGWRYATQTEISDFWTAFGGDSNHYNGLSTQNNGLFDVIAPLWGDLWCEKKFTCTVGTGQSIAITGDLFTSTVAFTALMSDVEPDSWVPTQDRFSLFQQGINTDTIHLEMGSALIRGGASVVPVPAAVWLFGSGLIGLIGVARRKV